MDGDENVCLFLRRLGNAIILRALNDLNSSKYGGYRFNTARNFCLGTTEKWKMSRNTYCELADIEEKKLERIAKKIIEEKKVEKCNDKHCSI